MNVTGFESLMIKSFRYMFLCIICALITLNIKKGVEMKEHKERKGHATVIINKSNAYPCLLVFADRKEIQFRESAFYQRVTRIIHDSS